MDSDAAKTVVQRLVVSWETRDLAGNGHRHHHSEGGRTAGELQPEVGNGLRASAWWELEMHLRDLERERGPRRARGKAVTEPGVR